MFKALFLVFLTITGLMHPTYSSEFSSGDFYSGSVFASPKNALFRFQIERNFSLKTKLNGPELQGLVLKAIHEANPKNEGLDPSELIPLSKNVVKVSGCYGIDPVIFTSLVWRESNFKPSAMSETGATGLTQMTHRGIQEVLERLSPLSHRRLGHLRALVKKCNPAFLERVPAMVSADTLAAWKNSVTFSHTDALVMGALLLKINLASVKSSKLPFNRIAVYQDALEKYNGDPKIKIQFAKDILLLSKRMIELPEVALNDSKFLSQIRGL